MASTTSGSFTPASAAADLAKEVAAWNAVIPVANAAQVVTPAAPQQSFTAYNMSSTSWVRATITLAAGITATGAAATRVQILPPLSVISVDLGSSIDDASGNIEAITSVSFIAVATPAATAEVGTLAAAAPAAPVIVAVNFGSK
jgi:hypothetical protein